MNPVSGVHAAAQASFHPAVASASARPAVALQPVKDADGDFDGTAVGQVDAKDFGKGTQLDRTA